MAKYNHAFSFGFELVNEDPEGNTTGAELRYALLKRLNSLPDDELVEACGAPFDTYEEDES